MFYAAKNFGVTGWVRNRRDGAVEAVAQGTEDAVRSFIEWAQRGPDLAQVESVEVSEAEGTFREFEIKETV